MRRLVVASTNGGKVREIHNVLEHLAAWSVVPLPPGLPVPDETGATFLENATRKAEFYSRIVESGDWVVADDSGLVVDALDGAPGIRSSRYAPTDDARNLRLLDELRGVSPAERTAQFVCALALARDGEIVWKDEGRIDGRIAAEPAGDNGFGFDPLFHVPGLGRTMGQLPPEAKNRISHRGRALAMLRNYLETERS